ncbi:MAG TPA: prepilin-type N-terminal cleavage/methylation domain-containing protein [Stellaceae bacterium]
MTRCLRERHSRAAGFTLVELAVALALAGLVSVILLYGVRVSALGLDRLSRYAEQVDDRRSIEALIRRAFASVAAIPVYEGAPSFLGGPTGVKFLSLGEDGGTGLYRVEIALDVTRRDRPLILSRRLANPSGSARPQQSVLLRNVAAFQIAYFGAVSPNDDPAWQARWEGLGYPPKLVRITFSGADGQIRAPIIVRLWNAG